MAIINEQIESILHNKNLVVSRIESYEEGITSKEEVIAISDDITDIGLNMNEDGQKCVLSCKCVDKEIYIEIENGTNDEWYLVSYFDEEVYGFEKLIEMTEKKKIFISGMIEQSGQRRRFEDASVLAKDTTSVYVNYNAYPYRIYQNDFDYCRVDRNFETFAACDDCLYIHMNNGNHVKICYSDYNN